MGNILARQGQRFDVYVHPTPPSRPHHPPRPSPQDLGRIATFFSICLILYFAYTIYTTITIVVTNWIITPIDTAILTTIQIVTPYWYVTKCITAGYRPDVCWTLSRYFPIDALTYCWDLGLTTTQCWHVIDHFPLGFTQQCFEIYGYGLMNCMQLTRLMH